MSAVFRHTLADLAEISRLKSQLKDIKRAEGRARDQISSAQQCMWALAYERELVEDQLAALEDQI